MAINNLALHQLEDHCNGIIYFYEQLPAYIKVAAADPSIKYSDIQKVLANFKSRLMALTLDDANNLPVVIN